MQIDLSPPWERVTFFDAIERGAGFDARAGVRRRAPRGARRAGWRTRPRCVARSCSTRCSASSRNRRSSIPTIVYDYPIEMSPLAKPRRGDPGLAERFEVIVGGTELVNAFSELNDPIDQWERFADQARARAAGDDEAPDIDADYVRALEYGLPPTGGLGLGVDRLVMLLTGQSAIRDVLLYPVLRDVD